jgi:hypothetical protein
LFSIISLFGKSIRMPTKGRTDEERALTEKQYGMVYKNPVD